MAELDEFDELMSGLVDELRALLDAGLEDERTGTDFSSGERFIIVSRRLWELATARPDRKQTRRGSERSAFSERERVFARVSERHKRQSEVRGK